MKVAAKVQNKPSWKADNVQTSIWTVRWGRTASHNKKVMLRNQRFEVLRRVVLKVITNVSEERIASIIRVKLGWLTTYKTTRRHNPEDHNRYVTKCYG
jgi:hypothetical protein